jgi:phosphoglycerate kinase
MAPAVDRTEVPDAARPSRPANPALPQLEDLPDVEGRRVLVRCDFNVPVRRGRLLDDLRIRSATPTLEWLVKRGAQVTVCTHLGRPGGHRDSRLSLEPVRHRLSELVPEAELMENLRFHSGEETNDPAFVNRLVDGQDFYVNDAFATAHRAHASVVGPPARLPAAAGRLFSREVAVLSALRGQAKRPFVAVLGGEPDPEKMAGIRSLTGFVDTVLLGGPVGFAAMTSDVPAPPPPGCGWADLIDTGRLVVPYDTDGTETGSLPVDIGRRTTSRFAGLISRAGTVFWDGTMGVPTPTGDVGRGSRAVAEAVVAARAFTVVSGVDTLEVLDRLRLAAFIDHVSTGGAAALAFLSDGDLPGLAALRRPIG